MSFGLFVGAIVCLSIAAGILMMIYVVELIEWLCLKLRSAFAGRYLQRAHSSSAD